METKSVLLVDAFADEPLGGVPVPVVTDGATPDQLRTVAAEFGASGAVSLGEEFRYVERAPADNVVEAAVAGVTAGHDRNRADLGDQMSVLGSDGAEQSYPVEHEAGDVRVEVPSQSVDSVSVSFDRLAAVLGVEAAGLENVGRELPVARSTAFGGTLFVPVGFLDDLSNCAPNRDALAAVLTETDTARVFAFTFDTVSRRADLHARVFDPGVEGCERPASGVATAGCGQYLEQHDAFEGGREAVTVECGRFIDRPATAETTLVPPVQVGGHGLTALETTLSLSEDDGDDIIEV